MLSYGACRFQLYMATSQPACACACACVALARCVASPLLPPSCACSLPFLRTTSSLRTFNGALARCNHDLEEWRVR